MRLALLLSFVLLFVAESFSTNVPILISPPNGMQNVSTGSNLAWCEIKMSGVAPTTPVTYTVQVWLGVGTPTAYDSLVAIHAYGQFWTGSVGGNADSSGNGLPSGFPVNTVTGRFAPSTTYYWRVRGGTILPWSTIWSFTTRPVVSVIPRTFTNRIQVTKDSRVFDIRGRLTSSKSSNIYISKFGTKLVVKPTVFP